MIHPVQFINKGHLFFLFIFCIGLGVKAQKINFSGKVQDSLQKPLLGASLVAIDQKTNALAAYTITADDGKFSLKLQPNTQYKIQVSALGLQTVNEPLTTKQDNIEKDLEKNWAVVSEAIQTILRREGYPKPYEALKGLTRTNAAITRTSIAQFIDTLSISDDLKEELKAITPQNYTGI